MQMLKNIFNSDKKYYLELDEKNVPQSVKQAVKTAEKVADVVQDKAEQVVETVQDKAETATQSEASPQTAKVADAKPQTSAKQKASKKNVQKSAGESEQVTQSTPQNAGASSYEPPFWVAAMYKNSNSKVNKDGTPAESTFATDNLMPVVTKYRRTPGPSLNKFKDMARKSKAFKG